MFNQLDGEEICMIIDNLLVEYINKQEHDIKEVLENHFNRSFSSIKQKYKLYRRTTICKTYEKFRFEYALENLKDNDCKVVMTDLGFKYESNFNRWFRNHKKMAPSEYRIIIK